MKALRQLGREIDEQEDQDLYAQILKYRPQCAGEVNSYLTQAPLKTMQMPVEAYQQWLHKMESPLHLTLTLKSPKEDGLRQPLTLIDNISVSVGGNKYLSDGNAASLGQISFQAKRNDKITIRVSVILKPILNRPWQMFGEPTKSTFSGSWTGSVDQLRSGLTIDLFGEGFTNRATFRATFSLSGIPPEPELPEWTRP